MQDRNYKDIDHEFIYKLYDQIYTKNLQDLNLSAFNEFDEINTIHYFLNKYSTERCLNYNLAIEELLPRELTQDKLISEDVKVIRQLNSSHSLASQSNFNQQWILFLLLEFFDGINRDRSNEEYKKEKKSPEILNTFGILSGIKIAQSQKKIFSENELELINSLKSNKYSPISISIPDFPYFMDDPEINSKFKGYFQTLIASGFKRNIIVNLDDKSKELYFESLLFKNSEFEDIFSTKPQLYDDFAKLNIQDAIPLDFITTLIEFYKNEISPLFNNEEIQDKFINILQTYSILLTEFYSETFKIESLSNFKKKCKSAGINWNSLYHLILESNSHRKGFRKYYKMLERPILRYNPENLKRTSLSVNEDTPRTSSSNDKIIISWVLIFDSFLYNLAKLIKDEKIKRYRGKNFEILISNLIKKILDKEPFKIILFNAKNSKTDPNFAEMKANISKFASNFETHFVDVTDLIDEKELFSFREYDVCFIYDDILFSLECKNKLYFKLTEIDQIIIKEFIHIINDSNSKENLLLKKEIKSKIKDEFSISYHKVKSRIITPIKISLNQSTTLKEFKNYLEKIRDIL